MENEQRIACGFDVASEMTGMSKSFLRKAADDPDQSRRLKTVRINRRRLIRVDDLEDWFKRVAREEPNQEQVA